MALEVGRVLEILLLVPQVVSVSMVFLFLFPFSGLAWIADHVDLWLHSGHERGLIPFDLEQ